ncbi:C-type mannose receptor 2-like isoform X2 [Pecten maximus]|uniref:C-type mannose receptor 2-like isoform X2 n=1 Tax=Pecten maximus TaxID=6579 RepID=UPI00145858D0|nr:C-type mannose receptor 2-like isoform X2 [Pecten maximus]
MSYLKVLLNCIFCTMILAVSGVVNEVNQCTEHSSGSSLTRSYYDICITFVSTKRSWNDANHACRSQGGLLVQITDRHMQDFVFEVLTSEHWADTGVWIGATDDDTEGRWIWSDGSNITYSNWHPGEGPVHHGFLFSSAALEDCGIMRVDDNGRWHDYSCGNLLFRHSYMCQYQKTPSLTISSTTMSPTTQQDKCVLLHPNDSFVQFYSDSCLTFVTGDKSWNDADTNCGRHGGLLLQIHSQQDQDIVYESLKSLHWSDSGAWIGATDSGSEGHWRWSDGNHSNTLYVC